MLLFIDHYDSFAHTLIDYFTQLGEKVVQLKTDQITDQLDLSNVSAVVIGPGPGHPNELRTLYPLITRLIDMQMPTLGVCLGHQLLAQYFGAQIMPAKTIMHGQCSQISHHNSLLYQATKSPLTVTRYHSLIVDISTLPDCLSASAITPENELMAFNHKTLLVYGIQYHPEAYLTDSGLVILQNFLLANQHLCSS